MQSKYTWLTLIVIVGIGLIALLKFTPIPPTGEPVTLLGITVPPVPTSNPKWAAQGEILYSQYCASCHGANLEGVPDWKRVQEDGSFLPPPHDSSGHTWHHPDPVLIEIITQGGDTELYNTKMPGFGEQLTETEIKAILDYIKSYWGPEEREYQWWLTAQEQ